MRALVTGSSGFVGSHLVRALEDRDDMVILMDKKSGELEDLTKIRLCHALEFWRPDIVFHLASTCSTLGSINDPDTTFRDTVMSAANVIDFARQREIPVIVTSSVKARDGMTPYGAAKQMVETWSLENAKTFNMDVVVNRPGTIYGPGQEGSLESGWVAWFLKAKAEKLTVTINGNGHQRRDLLHVHDYVKLMLLQADNLDLFSGRIWDVGGGEDNATTVLEMARFLGLRYEFGPARYGDAREYVGMNDTPVWMPTIHWWRSEVFRDL